MTSDDGVRSQIHGLSDEDLLAMVSKPAAEYTPIAWEMATRELAARGGVDAIRQRLAAEDKRQEDAGKRSVAALSKNLCPGCEKAEIRRRSGCLTPLLLGVGWIVVILVGQPILQAIGPSDAGFVAVALFAAVIVFLFGAVLASAASALFGRNKCKACGHKWR